MPAPRDDLLCDSVNTVYNNKVGRGTSGISLLHACRAHHSFYMLRFSSFRVCSYFGKA